MIRNNVLSCTGAWLMFGIMTVPVAWAERLPAAATIGVVRGPTSGTRAAGW